MPTHLPLITRHVPIRAGASAVDAARICNCALDAALCTQVSTMNQDHLGILLVGNAHLGARNNPTDDETVKNISLGHAILYNEEQVTDSVLGYLYF